MYECEMAGGTKKKISIAPKKKKNLSRISF